MKIDPKGEKGKNDLPQQLEAPQAVRSQIYILEDGMKVQHKPGNQCRTIWYKYQYTNLGNKEKERGKNAEV